MKLSEKIIFRIFALVCVLVSFFLYSPLYTHHFNSDHAVNVLMSFEIEFPEDYYFWGQTRLGSLVPLLGYCVTYVFGMEPLVAVTLVQYGLMTLTCIIFSRYIKHYFIKACFFVFWFFPVPIFPEIVYLAQPYAGQFFLIALAILGGEKYYNSVKGIKNIFLLFSLSALGISVWVSELNGLFFAFFVFILGVALLFKPITLKNKLWDILIFLVLFIITAGLAFLFVTHAKSYAIGQAYSEKTFVGWDELKIGLLRHWNYFAEGLERPMANVFNILYVVLLFAVLGLTGVYIIKKRNLVRSDFKSIITLMFLLNAVASTALIYMSDWVYLMKFEFRYWTYSFASLGVFLFFYWDGLYAERKKVATVLISLICFFQVIISVKYAFYEDSRHWVGFKLSELKDVKKLGNCGIIGNYWFAYICSAINPNECVATPHDVDFVRNVRLIPKVIAKDSIYIVKNNWLQQFNDTIYNYGVLLKKSGEPFNISKFDFCLYKKAPYQRIFKASRLMYRNYTFFADSSVILNKDTTPFKDFVVFGPLSWLNTGKYKATYYLTKGIAKDTADRVYIDVCSGWGKTVYASMEIEINKIETDSKFELDFELKEPTPSIEYRIYLKGKSSFVFKRTEVVQVP